MSQRFVPPPAEAVARARALSERILSADEVTAGLRSRLTDDQLEEALELIRWFRAKYRSPAERLAYARRTYARWARWFPENLRLREDASSRENSNPKRR